MGSYRYNTQMMFESKRQGGWTVWSLFIAMFVVIFFSYLGLILFPPYYDNLKLSAGLKQLSTEQGVTTLTRRSLLRKLEKILYVDFADELINLNEAFSIEKSKSFITLKLDYEIVVPVAYNISALIEFENHVDVLN